LERIEELKKKLLTIEDKIYNVGAFSSKYVKTIKSALSSMGICNDFVAMPFRQFNTEKRNRIKQNISDLELSGFMYAGTAKT
jgi:4-hydroxy-tetrahydrodipicolinate synthase